MNCGRIRRKERNERSCCLFHFDLVNVVLYYVLSFCILYRVRILAEPYSLSKAFRCCMYETCLTTNISLTFLVYIVAHSKVHPLHLSSYRNHTSRFLPESTPAVLSVRLHPRQHIFNTSLVPPRNRCSHLDLPIGDIMLEEPPFPQLQDTGPSLLIDYMW